MGENIISKSSGEKKDLEAEVPIDEKVKKPLTIESNSKPENTLPDACKDCLANQHDEEFGDMCIALICIKEYDYDIETRIWTPKNTDSFDTTSKCQICGFYTKHCQCQKTNSVKKPLPLLTLQILKLIYKSYLNVLCEYYRKRTTKHYLTFEKYQEKYEIIDRKRGIVIG